MKAQSDGDDDIARVFSDCSNTYMDCAKNMSETGTNTNMFIVANILGNNH